MSCMILSGLFVETTMFVFKATTGARWANLVVMALLLILMFPSDISTHYVIQLNLRLALPIHPNVLFTFVMGIVGIGQGYSCTPKYGNGASKNVKKTKCLQVRGLIV